MGLLFYLSGYLSRSNERPVESIGNYLRTLSALDSERRLLEGRPLEGISVPASGGVPLAIGARELEILAQALREQGFKVEKHKPNIVWSTDEPIPAHKDEDEVIIEGVGSNEAEGFQVVCVSYHNKPRKEPIGVVNRVSAQLTYSFFDGQDPLEIRRGAWLSEKDNRVDFGQNDEHALIVATIEGKDEKRLYAVRRDFDGAHPEGVTRYKELKGDLFTVRSRLIAESDGTQVHNFEMLLVVTRKPEFKVELHWALAWKMYYLSAYQSAGYDYMMLLYKIREAAHEAGKAVGDFSNPDVLAVKKSQEEQVAEQVKVWETNAANFIGLHLGEKERESFLNSTPSIDVGLREERKSPLYRLRLPGEDAKKKYTSPNWTLIDSIQSRVDILDGFRKTLS